MDVSPITIRFDSHGSVSIAGDTAAILPRIQKLWDLLPSSRFAVEDPIDLLYHLGEENPAGNLEVSATFHKTMPVNDDLGPAILAESLALNHACFVERYANDRKEVSLFIVQFVRSA